MSFLSGGSKVPSVKRLRCGYHRCRGHHAFEALHAHDLLKEEGILTRVIDLYSVKPIDHQALERAARETRGIVSVEDHFADGGLGRRCALLSRLLALGSHNSPFGKCLEAAHPTNYSITKKLLQHRSSLQLKHIYRGHRNY